MDLKCLLNVYFCYSELIGALSERSKKSDPNENVYHVSVVSGKYQIHCKMLEGMLEERVAPDAMPLLGDQDSLVRLAAARTEASRASLLRTALSFK